MEKKTANYSEAPPMPLTTLGSLIDDYGAFLNQQEKLIEELFACANKVKTTDMISGPEEDREELGQDLYCQLLQRNRQFERLTCALRNITNHFSESL